MDDATRPGDPPPPAGDDEPCDCLPCRAARAMAEEFEKGIEAVKAGKSLTVDIDIGLQLEDESAWAWRAAAAYLAVLQGLDQKDVAIAIFHRGLRQVLAEPQMSELMKQITGNHPGPAGIRPGPDRRPTRGSRSVN